MLFFGYDTNVKETIVTIFESFMATDLKYWALGVMSFLEGLPIVGSMVPGGTIAFLVGSSIPLGYFSAIPAFLVIGILNAVGDILGFFLSKKFNKHHLVKKYTDAEKFSRAWELFDKHLFFIVVLGRFLPVVRSVPPLLAGAKGISARKYVPAGLIASFLWAAIGVFFGEAIGQLFGRFAWMIIIGITLIFLIFSAIRKQVKKYKENKKKFEAHEQA